MSHAVRIEITSVTDRDGLQLVSGRTQVGEYVKDAVRLQGHGVSTHPPVGSVGLVVFAYGRRDMPTVVGLEHPEKRPRDQAEGGTTLYDGKGAISLADGEVRITPGAGRKVVMG